MFMMGIVMMCISCTVYADGFHESGNRFINLAAQVNYKNTDDSAGVFNSGIIAKYNGSLHVKNDVFMNEEFSICDGGVSVLELISTDWFSDCMDDSFVTFNDTVHKFDFVKIWRSQLMH